MDENQVALITEQIKHGLDIIHADLRALRVQQEHAIDLMQADLRALRAQQEHDRQMAFHRLDEVEERARDQETRLRAATDGVAQFKVWSGLASGSSSLISLAALVRAFLGG